MRVTRISALIILAAGLLSAGRAQEPVYTPDELLRLLGSRNGDVRMADAEVKAAEGGLRTARGVGRPALGVDANLSWLAVPSDPVVIDEGAFGSVMGTPLPSQDVTVIESGDPLYFKAGVQLNQVLWSWGRVPGAVALRKAELELADALAGKARTESAVRLYKALYSLRADRQLLAIVEEQERLARRMLTSIAASRDAGVITSLEYQDAALNVEGFGRTAASLRAAVDSLVGEITALAGLEGEGPFTISTEGLAMEPRLGETDIGAWRRNARERNPDLIVADRALDASVSGYELSRRSAPGRPDIGLSLGFGASGYLPAFADSWEEDDIDFFLNLTVAVKGTLVDFGSSAGTVESAEAGVAKSRAQLDGAARRLDSSVAALYTSLQALRGDVEYAERRVLWEEAMLADRVVRREAGSIGDLELLEARTEYLAGIMELTTKRMNYADAALTFLGMAAPETVRTGEAVRP